MKRMKAQASLEMVVGLIILLVVAAVVISLILYFINPKKLPNPGQTLSVREFETKCQEYCNEASSIEYCRYYWSGNDWNKNDIKYETVHVGKYEWSTCEDRVYCFLDVPCEDRFGMGNTAIQKCKDLLCQTYMEKYNNAGDATNAVKDDISFSSSCNLDSVSVGENWYKKVFIDQNFCG